MVIVMQVTWDDLEQIHLPGRLVLRHNAKLQYGYTVAPDETLAEALKKMQQYCKDHRDGNPRITGPIKIVEHTKINNVPLGVKLRQIFRTKND